MARWIARDEKQKASSGTAQEQGSAYPRKKEGPGNQRRMQCPVRNSKTEPLGQDTEECASRSESNRDGSNPKDITSALNGRLYLWFETFPATK